MLEREREKVRFEAMFSPASPFEFVIFCVATLVLSQLQGLLGMVLGQRVAVAVSLAAIVLLFVIWWWSERAHIRKRAARLAFRPAKEPPPAAKGLILVLSPYDPRDPSLKDPSKLTPLLERIKSPRSEDLTDADFGAINLFKSNLRPQIRAVEFHLGKGSLHDVWLITSQSSAATKGSEDAALILERYLLWKYPRLLTVHRDGLSAPEWDYKALWELAEKVFRDGGYKDEMILADITGGTKMMSVALALACIPPGRRMQYVYSERDSQGQPLPEGGIDPVVIDIDPILYA